MDFLQGTDCCKIMFDNKIFNQAKKDLKGKKKLPSPKRKKKKAEAEESSEEESFEEEEVEDKKSRKKAKLVIQND